MKGAKHTAFTAIATKVDMTRKATICLLLEYKAYVLMNCVTDEVRRFWVTF